MARPAAIRGDDYADLAAAAERGALAVQDRPGPLSLRDIRREFTVDLGQWDRMLAQLLTQLAEDAGNAGRGLALLGVPTPALISAWLDGPTSGTQASVAWLAEHSLYIAPPTPARRMRARRGDPYDDLAAHVRSFRNRGDGELDAARLRSHYTIRLRVSWLAMVADLLAAVVADAGEVERAATVLAVGEDMLAGWVRWLVSRGSNTAARSTWPLDPGETREPYLDLCEAIERGALDVDGEIDPPRLRESYCARLDSWPRMSGELLAQIVTDAGSIRQAAKVLDVPRSTLGAWLRRQP